jgi:hypothetical protein
MDRNCYGLCAVRFRIDLAYRVGGRCDEGGRPFRMSHACKQMTRDQAGLKCPPPLDLADVEASIGDLRKVRG